MTQEKNKKNLSFRAENLAVPEVLIEADPEDLDLDDLLDMAEDELEEIQYETLAIPEVHISKSKAK